METEEQRVALPLAVAPPDAAAVTLTARAARAFQEILESKGQTSGALKVGIEDGGCAGYQYSMALATEPDPSDIVTESNGVQIYLDGYSAHLLVGSEIDFVDSMMGRGFMVRNPNAQSTCGCGSSFNTSGEAPAEGACQT